MTQTQPEAAPNQIILTEDQFDAQYTPVMGTEGEYLREISTDIPDQESRYLWTVVDGDDGNLYIVSGWQYVGRFGYVYTEQQWPEGTSIEAPWAIFADDDDDENEGGEV